MKPYIPDFRNIVAAARNRPTCRTPLYEHNISVAVLEQVVGRPFSGLYGGGSSDRREFFRTLCECWRMLGYDTVSNECAIPEAMPGSGALRNHTPGPIVDRDDFERYPWDGILPEYIRRFDGDFRLLAEALPDGMGIVGGAGYGVFECVQDLVGYERLCLMSADDPGLYAALFAKVGDTMLAIWDWLLRTHGSSIVVCRFGDDLGFKTSTLISPDDIRVHVIPQYRRLGDLFRAHGKPFLLHSCGCIFSVMDDIIAGARIDAKHSNEDAVAPFTEWVDRYGGRIGIFGGIDTDVVARSSSEEIATRVREVMRVVRERHAGGFAIGSGNSIPDYVPAASFLAMIEAVRAERGA